MMDDPSRRGFLSGLGIGLVASPGIGLAHPAALAATQQLAAGGRASQSGDARLAPLSDRDFDTLADAIAAAGGRTIDIIRDWTLTTAIAVPANTHLVIGSKITQPAGASAFTVRADNVTIECTAGGKIVGTNSETPVTATIAVANAANVTIRGVRVEGSRNSVAFLGGCHNFVVDGAICWGGEAPVTSGSSSCIEAYGSAGNCNYRGLICNSFALGNVDVGIGVNQNSGDDQISVVNNFVQPCDSNGQAGIPHTATRMRYGIVFSYLGNHGASRQVSGNTIVGCCYAGLYQNAARPPAGKTLLSNNSVIDCGFGSGNFDRTDAGLRAGILLTNSGGVFGYGNLVWSCWTVGLKSQGNELYSTFDGEHVDLQCTIIDTKDPTITPAPAVAVYLTGNPCRIRLDINAVHGGPGVTGPAFLGGTGSADSGDVRISGRFQVTGTAGCIQVFANFGTVDTDHPWLLENLTLVGSDNAISNSNFNAGIWKTGNVNIRNVDVRTFFHGIYDSVSDPGRRLDRIVDGISLKNLNSGIANRGSGTIIVQNATIDNVATPFSGSYRAGSKVGGNIRIMNAGVPSSGRYASGDVCENLVVALGAAHSWSYDEARRIWVSRGNFI